MANDSAPSHPGFLGQSKTVAVRRSLPFWMNALTDRPFLDRRLPIQVSRGRSRLLRC